MKKILLIEDEKNLAFNLELNLKAEGFEVIHVADGADAVKIFETHAPFAAIILDVMLPNQDGFEIAKQIRSKDIRVGILMLTARAGDGDRLKGLGLGVDDYVTKPFHLAELLSRIHRMAKRAEFYDEKLFQPKLKLGSMVLDTKSCILTMDGKSHQLTALETDILSEFLTHPGEVLSREHLLNKVWGMSGHLETRTVDNFIVRLRKIIEKNPAQPMILTSIRGRGYRLEWE